MVRGSILLSSSGHCKARTQGLILQELSHCQLEDKASMAGEGRDKGSAEKIHSLWINPTMGPTYFCFSVTVEPINVLLFKSFGGEFSVSLGHQRVVSVRWKPRELSGLEM